MKISELCKAHGLSISEAARRYNIPLRSLQHWVGGDREPPAYLAPLLEKAILYDELKKGRPE